MTKTARMVLGVGLAVLTVTALYFGLRTIVNKPAPELTVSGPGPQISDAGGVQAMVTFEPGSQKPDTVAFTVALTTHSVELGSFDLTKISKVHLEPGGIVSDLTWTPKGATSGHHIEGTLTAKLPVALNTVKTIALEIQGLASPELRRYEWTPGAR